MLGWVLFKDAITTILARLDVALRMSVLPYGLAAATTVWLRLAYPDLVGVADFGMEMSPPAGFAWLVILDLCANVLALLWISVGWHRYVLLGERPTGWAPPFHGGRILGYLGRSLMVGAVALLIGLAVVVGLSVFLVPLGGPSMMPAVVAGGFLAGVVFFYRMGLLLPAFAVDARMSLNEALAATKGRATAIAVLALLSFGLVYGLQLPLVVEGYRGLITILYEIVMGWIVLITGAGVLTSLYASFEGRSDD
ncbi:hypothetical protein JSE7799_03446 [Jannaschia seosinensis]|uniref:Uncharacterized protein n=1 Tax=Jannaschia seosinensis TaxID=313367 RepID=A0A0M7BE91_9RHOB|nr:hypothetical protein [Jannaschia seosinensis]CUH40711.1 hypothetical protein JSE7799_03446 [Jannaschia seosinensis]